MRRPGEGSRCIDWKSNLDTNGADDVLVAEIAENEEVAHATVNATVIESNVLEVCTEIAEPVAAAIADVLEESIVFEEPVAVDESLATQDAELEELLREEAEEAAAAAFCTSRRMPCCSSEGTESPRCWTARASRRCGRVRYVISTSSNSSFSVCCLRCCSKP